MIKTAVETRRVKQMPPRTQVRRISWKDMLHRFFPSVFQVPFPASSHPCFCGSSSSPAAALPVGTENRKKKRGSLSVALSGE